MAAVLGPVKVLIATLEASTYPTSNLVKPYIGKMIDRLSSTKSTSTDYRGIVEVIKVNIMSMMLLLLLLFMLRLHYSANIVLCDHRLKITILRSQSFATY